MKKSIQNLILAAAMMGGAMTVTSCEELFGEWDKPTPVTPTPDPTPDPTPTPTVDPIERAKQLLKDAQKDGAVVKAAFTYNGKAYEATFKRENGAFTLQAALGDGLDATLQEVDGKTATDPHNFIFTIQNNTTGETLLQVFINAAEDTVEVMTVDAGISFSGVSVNGETVETTPTTGSGTVYVTGATLNNTTLNLGISQTATLVCTLKPANAADKTISWTSSDETIATVDQNGKVTAVAKGMAVITAEPKGMHPNFRIVSPKCEVYVEPVPVTGVTLNKPSLELTEGGTFTLLATIAPADATNKNVGWESSKTAVATVDQTGKVTAVAPGDAIITVTTKDGSKTATCTVKVLPQGTISDYTKNPGLTW